MEPMTDAEVRELVRGSWLGHVGLADGARSYVIPLFYGYDDGTFYFHSNPGLKESYIAATDEACLAITRAESEDNWASVLARGRIEKVATTQETKRAMDALMRVPLPPAYGFTETGEPKRAGQGMFFWKLEATEMTGRKSVRPG